MHAFYDSLVCPTECIFAIFEKANGIDGLPLLRQRCCEVAYFLVSEDQCGDAGQAFVSIIPVDALSLRWKAQLVQAGMLTKAYKNQHPNSP